MGKTGWSGLKFPFNFKNGKPETSDAIIEKNVFVHISESIQQIIGTFRTERPISSHIGLPSRLVFKSFSTEMIPYYESIVKEAIEIGEKRVSVERVEVDNSQIKTGVLIIRVYWKLLKYNIPSMTEGLIYVEGGD